MDKWMIMVIEEKPLALAGQLKSVNLLYNQICNTKSISNHKSLQQHVCRICDILHLWKGIDKETRRGSPVDNRQSHNFFHSFVLQKK